MNDDMTRLSGVKALANSADGIRLVARCEVAPELMLQAKEPQIIDAHIRGHLAGQLARQMAMSDVVEQGVDCSFKVDLTILTQRGVRLCQAKILRLAAEEIARMGVGAPLSTVLGKLVELAEEAEK